MLAALRTRSVTEMIFSMVQAHSKQICPGGKLQQGSRPAPSRSDAEAGEPAVQRAARQTEDAGGLGDVAALGGEGALDQVALDLLEGHVLEPRRAVAARAQHQIGRGDLVARG